MLNKKVFFSLIIILVLLLLPSFVFAQNKPKITVFPLENQEKDLQIDVISQNVKRTIELNLKMMDKYVVEDNAVTDYTGTNAWLLDYCAKNKIDNIIFGKANISKTGSVALQMSVYNNTSKTVTLTKTENAETLFDIFRASDLLAIGMIEGFSGMSLGFGELKFKNSGEKGNYKVYIDNVLAGENLTSLSTVIAGSKKVRITQERMFGSYVVYEKSEVIESKKITEIVFNIPGFLEKESASIEKEEKNIEKNWKDKSSSKSVDKSFAKLFEYFKVEGYSEREAAKKKEVEDKYLAWSKQKEEWGIKEGLGTLDKTYGISLFLGGTNSFPHIKINNGWESQHEQNTIGGKIGISFSVNLPYSLALQTELVSTIVTSEFYATSGTDIEVELGIFEIPLFVMYRLSGKYISIYGGPVFQAQNSATYGYHYAPDGSKDTIFQINEYNLSLAAGVKAEIPMFASTFLEFDIRYVKDLTTWIDDKGVSITFDYLHFTIGYGIKFGGAK